jgi:hypothetical protein
LFVDPIAASYSDLSDLPIDSILEVEEEQEEGQQEQEEQQQQQEQQQEEEEGGAWEEAENAYDEGGYEDGDADEEIGGAFDVFPVKDPSNSLPEECVLQVSTWGMLLRVPREQTSLLEWPWEQVADVYGCTAHDMELMNDMTIVIQPADSVTGTTKEFLFEIEQHWSEVADWMPDGGREESESESESEGYTTGGSGSDGE